MPDTEAYHLLGFAIDIFPERSSQIGIYSINRRVLGIYRSTEPTFRFRFDRLGRNPLNPPYQGDFAYIHTIS